MKTVIRFIIIFVVMGCNKIEKQNPTETSQPTQSNFANGKQQSFSKDIWKQIKRLPIGSIDTLQPDSSCFVVTYNNQIEYFQQNQLKFKDSLISYEETDKYKSYRLKNQNDIQIGINKRNETMQISFGHPKGGVAEGDYEYFRKRDK